MSIFNKMKNYGHEELVYGVDEATGLKTIIAIHSTALGPALGGARFWNYESEEDALYDVLRLSKGMSYKNAAAGLKLGGGKAVIIGDPKKLKGKEFFHAFGRVVNNLNGIYYTAEDVNTNTQDITYIKEVTQFVTGTKEISGNPSPFTALGVYRGMKAGVKTKFNTDSLKGMTIAVQGVGSVGYALCEYLHKEGAVLKVHDINTAAVERAVTQLGAAAVSSEEILKTECDIFAPCALGAVLNVNNVKDLKCKMVCGSANNVLTDASTGNELEALDILYLPDYIVNAGGVINCAVEITDHTYNTEAVTDKVNQIYDTTLKVLSIAKSQGVSTNEAANIYAMNMINMIQA